LAIVFSVSFQFTASDYPFGIFKLYFMPTMIKSLRHTSSINSCCLSEQCFSHIMARKGYIRRDDDDVRFALDQQV